MILWSSHSAAAHFYGSTIKKDLSFAHTGNICALNAKTFVLEKFCRCALLRDRDFCVSKIVGEIKHVKWKTLFETQNLPVCVSVKNVSVFESQKLAVCSRLSPAI